MKFIKTLGVLLLVTFLFSCSKDGVLEMEAENITIPDFKVIGEDVENIYQYSYKGSLSQGTQINLTQSLGLSPAYLTLRQVSEVLSFYSFSSGNFSVVQHNVITEQSNAYPDFYSISDERSIIWGTNSEDLLFLGYFSPIGSDNFGLRTIDPETGNSTDISIAINVDKVYDPLYYQQRLILSYRGVDDNFHVTIFNTETRSIIQTFDFNSDIPNILIDELGNLGIISGKANNSFAYQVYDIESLILINEVNFNLNKYLNPGPLKGAIYENTLYYSNSYAQPSIVPFGPAYFDFVLDKNIIIDMISIVRQVEEETQFSIDLTAMQYIASDEVFVMGYGNIDNANMITGGILIIAKDGTLLERIEVPFAPTYFIKP
jgi:hypothetical protein